MTSRNPDIGIQAAATYVPRYRLTGEEIARSHGRKGGHGARSLAGPDEDSLTLAIEAARRLPAGALDGVSTVVFCSTTPPYLVKNNASAAAAALGLAPDVMAFDAGGALRSGIGALLSAAPGTLILAGDITTSRPGSPYELAHGDAGVAVVVGRPDDAQAVVTDVSSSSDEIQDHWRDARQPWVNRSEDRFPVPRYLTLLGDAAAAEPFAQADHVVVSSPSARVTKGAEKLLDDRGKIRRFNAAGYTGAADLLVRLCDALAECAPGNSVLAVGLTDGCDVLRVRAGASARTAFIPGGTGAVAVPTYLDALTWRGMLEREPPRRPEPRVVSAPAALRGAKWKYSLLASTCAECDFVSAPPQQVCLRCGSAEHGEPADLTRRPAAIRTFSVDRLAYSLNPPMVAAVIGFDGGGRLEVELTDSDVATVAVGARVRMTFRRRHSSGGVHNYVWKATVEGGRA